MTKFVNRTGLMVFVVVSLLWSGTVARAGNVRVTYAATARIPRSANDPALPKGTQPCGAYPTSGKGTLRLGAHVVPPKRVTFKNVKAAKDIGVLLEAVVTDTLGVFWS